MTFPPKYVQQFLCKYGVNFQNILTYYLFT